MTATRHRYRRLKSASDGMGQIFTPPPVARLLAESLSPDTRLIVDLGAGEASLSLHAAERCPLAQLVLLELDESKVRHLRARQHDQFRVVKGDALNEDRLRRALGGVPPDAVISNPPYGVHLREDAAYDVITEAFPGSPRNSGWLHSEVAFAARAWQLIGRGASLGLIVPSPMIFGKAFIPVRSKLVRELNNLIVTQLDAFTFPGAEVQAFLLTGQKAVNRNRRVILRKASIDGEIISEISISTEQAVQRLDFGYYDSLREMRIKDVRTAGTLSDAGVSIVRGSRSKKEFDDLGVEYFHTTDFPLVPKHGRLRLGRADGGFNTAATGDIMIPRVGTRCLVRHAKVVAGNGFFTDCVYRIRAGKNVREKIWKTLSSSFGSEWRNLHAQGSCAKYLTVPTLLSMPLLDL